MEGRDIGGAYLTDPERRLETQNRRAALKAAGRCINGPLEDRPGKRAGVVHGPANPVSGKCERCEQVAKRTR
jgi:hypothetical protein